MQLGNVVLRPSQIVAVEKLRNLSAVLVGDDTGGGKTITCLALVQQLWDVGEVGPVLIVTKSFDVWTKHLAMMEVDSDRIFVIDEKKRQGFIDSLDRVSRFGNLAAPYFYIMHWEGLPLDDMTPALKKIKWLCIIADEAHKAKNRKSQRTKALKSLRTSFKIAATATPGDNVSADVWSLLNWLYPKKYTSFWKWVRYFIECEDNWRGYTVFGGPVKEHIQEFLDDISPFYIARTLDEIDDSVPKMVYSSTEVDMSPEQAQAYTDIVKEQMAWLGDDLLVAGTQLEASQRMHQLANSFGHLEVGTRWKIIDGERVKVATYHVRLEEPSTKLNRLMEILDGYGFMPNDVNSIPFEFLRASPNSLIAYIPTDEPIVIFTTYRDMVEMACRRMDDLDISYVACTGKSELSADEAAAIFQRGDVRVFIGTAQTIGESITLTRAHICIYIDVHWSPRVKKQCDGRIRRIGQTRIPWAIDIKTRDSVDFVKLDKVRAKAAWLDAMFGRDNG